MHLSTTAQPKELSLIEQQPIRTIAATKPDRELVPIYRPSSSRASRPITNPSIASVLSPNSSQEISRPTHIFGWPNVATENNVQCASSPMTIPMVYMQSRTTDTTLRWSTELDLNRPEHRRKLLCLILSYIYQELCAVFNRVGLGLLPFLHMLASPAASMPMLLSNNFIIMDFLGRKHSLSLDYFEDWTVLDSLLRGRFKDDVAGFQKVHRGQYRIFNKNDPSGLVLDASNWRRNVGPRKRFIMTVIVSTMQLTDLRCTACRARLRKENGVCYCPKQDCGMSLALLTERKRPPPPKKARLYNRISAMGEDGLLIPHELDRHGEFDRRRRHFHRMLQLNPKEPAAPAKDNTQNKSADLKKKAPLENDVQVSQPPSSEEDEEVMPVDNPGGSGDWNDKSSTDDVISTLAAEEATQERNHMRYFRHISIKQDSSLYDAVSQGNIRLARALIQSGVEVDLDLGPLGTALMPAILSGSHEFVRLLLDEHASPIFDVGDGYSPLSLAARYGCYQGFIDVLQAARKTSQEKPLGFQRAVDRALLEATIRGDPDIIVFLLLAGANPVAQANAQGTSAIEIGLGHHQTPAGRNVIRRNDCGIKLSGDFLIELWLRHLLNDEEARVLYRSLRTEPNESEARGWLLSCARNLNIGRAKILGKKISERLEGSLYFKAVNHGPGFQSLFEQERIMSNRVSYEKDGQKNRATYGTYGTYRTYLVTPGMDGLKSPDFFEQIFWREMRELRQNEMLHARLRQRLGYRNPVTGQWERPREDFYRYEQLSTRDTPVIAIFYHCDQKP